MYSSKLIKQCILAAALVALAPISFADDAPTTGTPEQHHKMEELKKEMKKLEAEMDKLKQDMKKEVHKVKAEHEKGKPAKDTKAKDTSTSSSD